MARKRYRRLKPQQLNLWQARLDAVQKRLAQPPSPSMTELGADEDFEEGLQRAFTGLGEMLAALRQIGATGIAKAEDAELTVLCRVLAPRLAPYADEDHNVEREALVHVAALALDNDLAMLEEMADTNDQMRFADDNLAKAQAAYVKADQQALEAVEPVLAALRELDGENLPEGAPAMLQNLIATSLTGLEVDSAPERQRLSEEIVRRASNLLERHLAATGGLPD